MASISNSNSTMNSHSNDEGEYKIIMQMMEFCRAFLSKKASSEDTIKHLRGILVWPFLKLFTHQRPPIYLFQQDQSNAALLFDVLVALQAEFDDERARKAERAEEVRVFLEHVSTDVND